jgi:hypothetical protein
MSNVIRSVAAAAGLVCLVPAASAQLSTVTLKFDNLVGTEFFGTPPSAPDYVGFKFGDMNPASNDWFWSDQPEINYGPKSGNTNVATDHRLYSFSRYNESSAITFDDGADFKLRQAWFSGDGGKVRFVMYRNGNVVKRSAWSTALSNSPVLLKSGYSGWVDEVRVQGFQGYYAMDNFRASVPTVTVVSVSQVPEPSTYAMLGLGLAAVGVVAARRRRMAA